MKKWRGVLAAACAMALSGSAYAAVGIFDGSLDLGDPGTDPGPTGLGSVVFDGAKYTVMGGGSDWWDGGERGHFVYKQISGNLRIEADINILPVDPANPTDWSKLNDWAKLGLAFRNDIAAGGAEAKEVNAFIADLKPSRRMASLQARYDATQNMNNTDMSSIDVQKLAIQRKSTPWGYYVEGFVYAGGSWRTVGDRLMSQMADSAYVGLAVTSHDNDPANAQVDLAGAEFSNVAIGAATPFVNVPLVARISPYQRDLKEPGFKIHTIKNSRPWNYGLADMMLQDGSITYDGVQEGTRIDPVVNLHDTSSRGGFTNDSSYPGIDKFQQPTADPADGDDDNYFATEATGYIFLTEGLHRITANSDDGTIITIGGIEIGRTAESKGASDVDFIFDVAAEGIYTFRAMNIEGSGGASFELADFDGASRVLLNTGGMLVGQAVPEPAALGMLAMGALGLLARRRRA